MRHISNRRKTCKQKHKHTLTKSTKLNKNGNVIMSAHDRTGKTMCGKTMCTRADESINVFKNNEQKISKKLNEILCIFNVPFF